MDHHKKYEAAMASIKIAQRAHDVVAAQYRERLVNDEVFLASRRTLDEAEEAFDAAERDYITACSKETL